MEVTKDTKVTKYDAPIPLYKTRYPKGGKSNPNNMLKTTICDEKKLNLQDMLSAAMMLAKTNKLEISNQERERSQMTKEDYDVFFLKQAPISLKQVLMYNWDEKPFYNVQFVYVHYLLNENGKLDRYQFSLTHYGFFMLQCIEGGSNLHKLQRGHAMIWENPCYKVEYNGIDVVTYDLRQDLQCRTEHHYMMQMKHEGKIRTYEISVSMDEVISFYLCEVMGGQKYIQYVLDLSTIHVLDADIPLWDNSCNCHLEYNDLMITVTFEKEDKKHTYRINCSRFEKGVVDTYNDLKIPF
jgi:hypothetical protein